MFFPFLNAKMTEWLFPKFGGLVFVVPPQNTSRVCPVCWYEDNADAIATENILGREQCL